MINTLKLWIRQLRLHQWVKNLLVFVPLLASFNFSEARISLLSLAFVSFSLVSSAVYSCNDLMDLENDRAHAIKRNRPLAAGLLSSRKLIVVASALLIIGVYLGYLVGPSFLLILLAYLVLTFIYTIWLKRIILVDVIGLAGLYTLRVVAGGFAVAIELSFWLIAFSVFFFLSLAFVKRYAELESLQKDGEGGVAGRGYAVNDMPLILVFGAASAFLAVLIFALYLDSTAVREQYLSPEIGWLAIPFLLYLIGRMWFKAHRGQMNQDPVLFLLRDLPSIITVLMMGAALVVAHLGVKL